MALGDYFGVIEADPDQPDFIWVRRVEEVLAATTPARLDRARSSVRPFGEGVAIELHHRDDPGLTVYVEGMGDEVVVSYGEEHEHFDAHQQAASFPLSPASAETSERFAAFLTALLTGRIELHVTHRLLWVSTRSYWIDDAGRRQQFLAGGTLIPTLQWSRVPIIRLFDYR